MPRGFGPGRRTHTKISSRKGTFDPDDVTHVKHARLGIWDLYSEKNPQLERIPWSSKLEGLLHLQQCFPYVWRMLLDIGSLRSCWTLLFLFCLFDLLTSFLPALSIW